MLLGLPATYIDDMERSIVVGVAAPQYPLYHARRKARGWGLAIARWCAAVVLLLCWCCLIIDNQSPLRCNPDLLRISLHSL